MHPNKEPYASVMTY